VGTGLELYTSGIDSITFVLSSPTTRLLRPQMALSKKTGGRTCRETNKQCSRLNRYLFEAKIFILRRKLIVSSSGKKCCFKKDFSKLALKSPYLGTSVLLSWSSEIRKTLLWGTSDEINKRVATWKNKKKSSRERSLDENSDLLRGVSKNEHRNKKL